MNGESKEKKKKREDRVSGRSWDGDSSNEHPHSEVDTNSFSNISNNMMQIPEDTENHEPYFGLPNNQNCKDDDFEF